MARKKSKKKVATRTRVKTKAAAATKKRRKTAARPKAAARKSKGAARKSKAAKAAKRAQPKSVRRRAGAAPAKSAVPATPSITALPPIEVETTGGQRLRLSDLKGRNVVLYFYPKDDTPGCTTEGCEIRDHYDEFTRHDAVVYGVSRDGLASHERFKSKFGFPFELIADPDEKLCRAFGVMREKSLYGRTYLGVDRSTFVFDKAGLLRKEFRGVKVPGHVEQVLEELRRL